MIDDKLIHFKTYSAFEKELQRGNISNSAIVFIKDTRLIYTHGLLYLQKGDPGQSLESVTIDVSENDPPLSVPSCQYTYLDGNLVMTFFDMKGEKGDQGETGTFDSSELENYATKDYVGGETAKIVGSAPAALDTLGKIATALNNDTDLAGTLTTLISQKIPKVAGVTAGNFAALAADGTLVDSGHKHTDYITSETQADWNEGSTASPAYIQNKPSIPNDSDLVHTSGNETINGNKFLTGTTRLQGTLIGELFLDNDLYSESKICLKDDNNEGWVQIVKNTSNSTNSRTTLQQALDERNNVQADWNESSTTSAAYIKNKPTIPTVPTISTTVTENDTNPVSGGAVYSKFADLIGSAPEALDTLQEIAEILAGNDDEENPVAGLITVVGQKANAADVYTKGDVNSLIQGIELTPGPQGADGKGISSITNYYLATPLSSNVTTSTNGWTTSVLTITSTNKYLWNYEAISYTEGLPTYTSPHIIGVYGDKGENGTNGSDGRSVTSITEYYLASSSSSGITRSSTGWSTTIQPITSTNKYLWNYKDTLFSDNNHSYTTPVIIGVYGDKGDDGLNGSNGLNGSDGKGITSITSYYLATTSSSGITKTSNGWTTSVQSMTNTNRYLWNYEDILYTDNTHTYTDPHIIGVYGDLGDQGQSLEDVRINVYEEGVSPKPYCEYSYANGVLRINFYDTKGQKGDNGKGITSVTKYYLASSSSSGVTSSTNGWTTTVLSITSTNKYLWSYDDILYTDNNHSYTTPIIIGVYGDKGNNGNDGKSINSVTNYYLATASSSGVTRSTNGWTTTIQTIDATKKYLWNYETISYSEGQPTYTDPCIIGVYGDKGENGTDGTNGTNGRGITSITDYYLASASSNEITRSTNGWTTSIQSMDSTKKYLWNYEDTLYTDNTHSYTTPVIIGVYGDKGDTGNNGNDGKGISSITNYYLATSESSNITKNTSGWTTSILSMTSTNKYLWNYEDILYTDNSHSYTTPIIIGVRGDNGSNGTNGTNGTNGANGRGITSITSYYLASSVSTGVTRSTTGWSTTVQTMTSTNKYLWNYEDTLYTDNTHSYTDPHIIGIYGDKGDLGTPGQSLTSVTVSVTESNPPSSSPSCQYTYQNGALAMTFYDLKGDDGDPLDVNQYVDNTVVINMDNYGLAACSLGTNSKWYNSLYAMYHRAIPVQEGDVFKLTPHNLSDGPGVLYGLLTSSYTGVYTNGGTTPYVSGEERHFALEGETTTITIPSGCAYLIICDKDGSGQKYYTLRKVVSNPINNNKLVLESYFNPVASKIGVGDKIRVCAWNIGCFHNGDGGTSSIPRANYVDYSMTWKNILNNINADCLCLSEFNPNFVEASGNNSAISSRTEIFGNYPYDSIGTKNGQLCEAIISNRVLSNCNFITFSKGSRYYAVTTIHIGEIPVRLASIHLDYLQNSTGLTNRTAQIADLIRDLSAMDHVIICGDTNVASMSELDPLVNAGFQLVNGGHLGQLTTYDNNPEAATQYLPCIDNIIVKGFSINDVRVYGVNKSDVFQNVEYDSTDTDYIIADHHPIAATLTLI